MKFTYLFVCLMSSICFSAAAQADLCQFRQSCEIGTICSCTNQADYIGRFVYFDFPNIKKNNNYTCKFTSTVTPGNYNDSMTSVPKGSTATCTSANCPNLPLTININTQKMIADKGKASILLSIDPNPSAASDLTADCEISN